MLYTDYTDCEAMAAASGLSSLLVCLRLWMLSVADGVLTDLEARLYHKHFHFGLSAAQIRLGYQRTASFLPEHMRAAVQPGICIIGKPKGLYGGAYRPLVCIRAQSSE